MIITFIGHAFLTAKGEIMEKVRGQMRANITDELITCYLGGYGDFDEICASVCRELKNECLLELVYVTPYISLSEQAKIKELQEAGLYDKTIYPSLENVPKRFAISRRNKWMLENADLVIAYVDHSYGGAYKSLLSSKRKVKKLINIADLI